MIRLITVARRVLVSLGAAGAIALGAFGVSHALAAGSSSPSPTARPTASGTHHNCPHMNGGQGSGSTATTAATAQAY
ncbi:MAG TPA: hypothetical protein VGH10_10240 [Actinomycetota bacterium]